MLPISTSEGRIHVGGRFSVSFQRTAAGSAVAHSYGALPFRLTADGAKAPRLPGEGIWLGFSGKDALPTAVQIYQGDTSLIDRSQRSLQLRVDPRNYLVVPAESMWPPRGHPPLEATGMEFLVYEPVAAGESQKAALRWDVPFFELESQPADAPLRGFGPDYWASPPGGTLRVAFLTPEEWRDLTGETPPAPAALYRGVRLP